MTSETAFKACPTCRTRAQTEHKFCPGCGADLTDVEATFGDPNLEQVIAGKYRLVRLLGEGAMGQVYKAEQVPLGKPFAVKLLAPSLMHDEASRTRFAAEAHNAASLNHPNCVSVVDFGRTADGLAYIVMEFVDGRTLEDVIAEDYPLPRDRVLDLTLQILAALAEAHGLGILHRDLKPENILVQQLRTHGELAKVVDFGIAKLMDSAEQPERSGLTRQGMICGTPEYMSPEQARGQKLDARSDLYAVGCILYQMLTGRPPFESASAVDVLHRHLSDPPVPPSTLLGLPPDPLEEVCLRVLSKVPDDRYPSAIAFREALVQVSAARDAAPVASACWRCRGPMGPQDKFCAACGASSRPATPRPSTPRRRHPTRRSSGLLGGVAANRDHTASMLVRRFPLPLRGRDAEVRYFGALLERPGSGVRAEVLAGPPGSGKTRLLDEISALAEGQLWRVHYVGADPTGATRPLLPIRSIVGAVFDLDPQRCTTQDLGRAANLSGLAFEELPGLAELFGLEGPARGLEHAVRRRECLASAVQSLLTAGTGEPLLLIFDDIDGFDPPSREILRRLAHHPVQRPVVILASTAEADTAWLTPHRHELAPFSPQEAAALCGQLAGDLRPGSNLASRVDIPSPCTASHLEAQLRLMAAGVAFTPGEDESELLRKWLDQLPVSTRRVLQCAAVLGERMHEADLADLAERDPLAADDDFEEGLARLHVEGVLLVIGGGERAFSHPTLQHVAHRMLTPARAATLHDLAGKYSRLARSSLAVRAIHLLAAGAEGAADALEAAADEAERGFGDQAASDYLQAALQALGRQRADPARLHAQARIATKLARVVRGKGQAAAGLALTEAQLKDAHTHPDQARLHHARGRYLARLGRHEEAEAALRQSLSAAILHGDREQILDLYRELSEECTRRGNLQGAIAELQEGLDLCTLGEGPRARLDLPLWRYLLAISAAIRASGHPSEARPWCTHALFQADQDGDLLGQMRCHAELGVLMRDTSQPLLAEQHTARALEHARYFGDRLSSSELLLERARLRAARGEVAEARHCCDEALRLAKVVEWKAGVRAAERALELLGSQST